MTTTALAPTTRPQTRRARRIAFTVLTALMALVVAVPFGGYAGLVNAFIGGPEHDLHRVHEMAIGIWFGLFLVPGLVLSLWRASRYPAASAMAVIATATLTALLAITGITDPVAWVVLALMWASFALHPALPAVLGRGRRLSLPLAVAAAGLAVPWVGHTVAHVVRHFSALGSADPHAVAGHYMGTAAMSVALVGIGAMTALRLGGYRITGWIAGAASVLYGAASLFFDPRTASVLSLPVALLAIAVGAAFIAATEIQARRDR